MLNRPTFGGHIGIEGRFVYICGEDEIRTRDTRNYV